MFWSGGMVGRVITFHVLEGRNGKKINKLSFFGVEGW